MYIFPGTSPADAQVTVQAQQQTEVAEAAHTAIRPPTTSSAGTTPAAIPPPTTSSQNNQTNTVNNIINIITGPHEVDTSGWRQYHTRRTEPPSHAHINMADMFLPASHDDHVTDITPTASSTTASSQNNQANAVNNIINIITGPHEVDSSGWRQYHTPRTEPPSHAHINMADMFLSASHDDHVTDITERDRTNLESRDPLEPPLYDETAPPPYSEIITDSERNIRNNMTDEPPSYELAVLKMTSYV